MRTQFTLFALLAVLILSVGCEPPWRGEECNYHVVNVAFWNVDMTERIALDSIGYTEVRQLERGEIINPDAWGEVDELTFRRLDPVYDLILPVDPEAVQSSFVLAHPNGNDTLIVRYTSRLGNDRARGCGYSFLLEDPTYSFQGSTFQRVSDVNHPRIIGEVEVYR